jgi:alkaline phosphatase
MPLSRRTLLTGAGLGATGASRRGSAARRPKNVIFCVADGMPIASLTLSDQFQRIVHGHPSVWAELLRADDTVTGLQETRSLNSLVTDSSAASSAWGSGRHIWNSHVNRFPDGTELRPLASLVSEIGVRVGLVTTTRVTHATPAGFAVSVPHRDQEDLIAERYLKAGVTVLLGGGYQHFAPEKRKDKRDLWGEFGTAGWHRVRDRAGLLAAPTTGPLLGAFSDSHTPYRIDRAHDPALARVPSLAECAQAAIARLRQGSKGFLLLIEGGKVDHGGHANDLAAMLYDQIDFEAAVKGAVDFARADGETLVIVTADHACGGIALNGAGTEYIESTAGLLRVARMRASYEPIFAALGETPTASQVRSVIAERLQIVLSDDESEAVAAAAQGRSPLKVSTFYGPKAATLGAVLGNTTKVTWTSLNHTSDHVLVTALGPGRGLAAGLVPNVAFFDRILAVWDLRWTNPTMDFATAQRFMARQSARLSGPDGFLHA